MEGKGFNPYIGSNFVTVPGMLLLAFFAVLSVFFKAYLVGTFLALFFVLAFLSFFWSRMAVRHLTADVLPIQAGCFAGEELQFSFQLQNNGSIFTAWAQVLLPLPDSGLFDLRQTEHYMTELKKTDWSGEILTQRFTWISSGEQVSCTRKLKTKKRGIFTVGQLGVQSGDGFGIGAGVKLVSLQQAEEFAIYPKIYPVRTELFFLGGSRQNRRQYGQAEDVTLLKNIRPYQYGDSYKRMNWRMLAKAQEPYVNIYETMTPGHIVFCLDMQSFSYKKHVDGEADDVMEDCIHEDLFELAVSLTASVMLALGEKKTDCTLFLPAYGEKAAECCHFTGGAHGEGLLRTLAEITYAGGQTEWPAVQLAAACTGNSVLYVVMEGGMPQKSWGDFQNVHYIKMKSQKTKEQPEWDCLEASEIFYQTF